MTDKFGKELEVGCFVGRTLSRSNYSCGLYRVFGFHAKSIAYCMSYREKFNDYKWALEHSPDLPKFNNQEEMFEWAKQNPEKAIENSWIFEPFKQETLIKTFAPYWLPYKKQKKE